MVMDGMLLYNQKGKQASETVSNLVPFSNMKVTTLCLLSTNFLVQKLEKGEVIRVLGKIGPG